MTSPPPLPILLLMAAAAAAAQPPASNDSPGGSVQVTFRPSIAVVIGIFSIMFSLTFLLLMYGKFCRSNNPGLFAATGFIISSNDGPRCSGMEKALIESLPFFKFSALKGSREGLECSVCLSRFENEEILRLLPRCKHAFHKGCIDQWLESHSSCPLCRTRVDIDDIAFFKYSASSRHLGDPSESGADSALELYVEREPTLSVGSTSRRLAERLKFTGKRAVALHNFKHRILVSQVVFRSRWSDFNSADLISLDSEMLRVMSSQRFDMDGEGIMRMKEEMERKRSEMRMTAEESSSEILGGEMRALISPASRCMSDISGVRSYRAKESGGGKEEKVREKWLPIARRTVKRFAGNEGGIMMRRQDVAGEENV